MHFLFVAGENVRAADQHQDYVGGRSWMDDGDGIMETIREFLPSLPPQPDKQAIHSPAQSTAGH